MSFDPSLTASHKLGLFGLPADREEAELVIVPVPWEVTTSYGSGTSRGPQTILEASPQIDLFDIELGKAYEKGYFMEPISEQWLKQNDLLKQKAQDIIDELEEAQSLSPKGQAALKEVNQGCAQMVEWVYNESRSILERGQSLGLIGGDHSSPLGAIRAISEHYKGDFGILHVDAHADLRKSYQGFEYSHASIMRNVMDSDFAPKQLVQIGIRDFCEEEYLYIQENERIDTFFDQRIKEELLSGTHWSMICREVIDRLPENVYVSFDIDGLSPEFCPHTGTPVPGGLSFDQAVFLLSTLRKAKRKIVGFDLNEVAPGEDTEWDGNVGARLLFKLCGHTVLSR